MKLWNELSMKEKHNIIRESVSKGIHSLDDIKAYYDNYYKDDIHLFLKGGERNYQTWKSLIAKYKGLDIDNDNTYDYEGYYNAYPNEAWDMLNDNPEVHFTDEFKTVYHPTFSNESSYNGKVNMLFNPYGKLGGTWTAGDVFIPAHNLPWPNKFAEGGDEDNLEAKAIKNFSKQNSEPFYSNFLANGYDENEAFQKAKQYYEEFKDSDKFLFDEGDLPEIIIKPSKNDRMSLTKLQRMIPDAASRQAMYDVLAPSIAEIPIISQNESIDRLYNIYASSKYPTVSSNRTLGNYLGALIRKENLNRPNYDIITNTISIPSEDTKYDATGFIPELAHAYQYHANDKRIKDNDLNSIFNLPGDIKINGKSGYERPGNREYSAHSIIEPAIWDYVEGKSNNIDFTPYLNPDAQRPYKTYHYHSQGGPLVYAINKYVEGGPKEDEPVLFTPYLNDTPMQAAIRQLNADWNKSENRAATYNATHPVSPSNGGFVMNSDGSFSKVNPNPTINTMAEPVTEAASFMPVIGDAMYAGEVYNAAKQGNYGTAVALAGLAPLPNFMEKPLKKTFYKVFRKYDPYKYNYTPKSLNFNFNYEDYISKLDLENLTEDKFVDFLEKKTGKSITRKHIKQVKPDTPYDEGFAFVDGDGKIIASIAGPKHGNNVWVESSYVDPEFRSQGLGKQMYIDFNEYIFNNKGTTLRSFPGQHQFTLIDSNGRSVSPSSNLWRGLKSKGYAVLDPDTKLMPDYIMAEPSKMMDLRKYFQGGPLVQLANKYDEGGPKSKRFVDVLGNIVSAFGITPKYPDTMPTLWSEVLPEESYTELPTMTANQIEGKVIPLPNNNEDFIPDFANIKTKDNFGYNIDNLTTAYHYFKDNMKLNDYQIASLLANGIAESGFDPKAHNPKTSAKGLYQWLDGRYKYSSDKMSNTELLNELLQYINDTLNNTEDLMSWHHGGDGSGYNKAVEAHDRFYNAKNLYDAVHSFTYGYNRPDSVALRVKQRYDLAQKILERLLAKLQHKDGGKIYIKPENRGKFTALKKRTGHSASWFKAHGTPALKKMATFALNAKKWKHDDGGFTDIPNLLLPPTNENLIYSGHKSWYNR